MSYSDLAGRKVMMMKVHRLLVVDPMEFVRNFGLACKLHHLALLLEVELQPIRLLKIEPGCFVHSDLAEVQNFPDLA